MYSIKRIFFTILGLNILAVLIFSVSYKSEDSNSNKHVSLQTFLNDDNFLSDNFSEQILDEVPLYHFTDPKIAKHILGQLDVFEVAERVPGAKYNGLAGGLKANNNYCQDHRAYFVEHPELVFEKKNFVTNYWRQHKLRTQVIPMIDAKDLHSEISVSDKKIKVSSEMRLDANIFFTYNLFYMQRQVGKQFSCLSQVSNHIPGHDKMYRKDYVGQSLVDYAKKYASRPECFNFKKYFPKTWLLQNKNQCLEFFKEFNSEKYEQMKEERNVVYFRKIGAFVHEGRGVFPVNNEQEVYIRNKYKNGTLCGKVKDNNLIQYNVHNPLLLENRKFGFRMFLLIASTNPVLAYYHDGYARLSLNEYDATSKEIKTFVTNIGVNIKEASKGTEWEKLTPQQIQDRTCWFLEDFHKYLMEQNIIQDPNWLENHLRPEFKKVMVHLLRMTQSGFFQKSSLFEIFGLDFVMDENLNLWFIEANSKPLMNGFTKDSTVLLNRMMIDSFEIVLGLLKSRMKRAIAYVNALTREVNANGLVIPNLQEKREYFKEITKNYFEPEFEPSPENTFHKIIDDREYGVKRYNLLLDENCL